MERDYKSILSYNQLILWEKLHMAFIGDFGLDLLGFEKTCRSIIAGLGSSLETVLELALEITERSHTCYAKRFLDISIQALKEGISLTSLSQILSTGSEIEKIEDWTRFKDIINSGESAETKTRQIFSQIVSEKYGALDNDLSIEHLIALSNYATHVKDAKIEYDEKKAIADILRGKVVKPFSFNKVYKEINLAGLSGINASLEDAASHLVYALFSTRPSAKYEEAIGFFSCMAEEVRSARAYAVASGLRNRLFRDHRNLIQRIKEHHPGSGKELIEILRGCRTRNQSKIKPLFKVIAAVESASGRLTHPEKYVYKTQSGTAADLFNNNTTYCCTFLPDGEEQEAAALYVMDPDFALIQCCPYFRGRYHDPVGVAITFFATDDKGKNLLVVYAVEGGNDLLKSWRPDFLQVLQDFGRDMKVEYLLFNTLLREIAKPLDFLSHVAKTHPHNMPIKIRKKNGTEMIERYGTDKHYLECFSGWEKPEGVVLGLYLPLS